MTLRTASSAGRTLLPWPKSNSRRKRWQKATDRTAFSAIAPARSSAWMNLESFLTAVQPQGLKDLKTKLLTDKTKIGEANISTIEEIKPYKVEEDQLTDLIKKVTEGLNKVKLRLFRYKDQVKDAALLRGLLELMNELGLPEPELLNYGKRMRMRIMRVTGIKPDDVLRLAGYVGTQNVSEFPEFYVVRELQARDPLEQENFPPPEEGVEYPVVGIIDSGTPVNDPILSPWRVDRYPFFLPQDQDNWHGSFVAGLLTHPRQLNLSFQFASC